MKPQVEPVAIATGCELVRQELEKYDGWNVNIMTAIARAESGCIANNHNYGDNHGSCQGSYGIMQVGCIHGYSADHLSSISNNVAVSYKIWQSQGYTAWGAYTNESYKEF